MRAAIATQNWNAALFTSLCLPEICAAINDPASAGPGKSRNAYEEWTRIWLEPLFTTPGISDQDIERMKAANEEHVNAARDGDKERYFESFKELGALWRSFVTIPVVTIRAGDVYALRCAFLHTGDHDISQQKAREVFDKFLITAPSRSGNVVHRARVTDGSTKAIQVQVDLFCETICQAVDRWMNDKANDPGVQVRLREMPEIKCIS